MPTLPQRGCTTASRPQGARATISGRALVWLMLMLMAAGLSFPLRAAEPLPGEYRVQGDRVDAGTYSGWRIFHTSCHGCHGVGGTGTDLAPNLVERIKTMTPRGFATKVLTSYRIVGVGPDDRAAEREALIEEILRQQRTARGQVVMPAWENDPEVPPHVLDLYAYLNARADGVLGPGRPRPPAARR